MHQLPDIKPRTEASIFRRDKYQSINAEFPIASVSVVLGMSQTFIRRLCGRKRYITVQEVLFLLDQDCYGETIVPRSVVIDYLVEIASQQNPPRDIEIPSDYALLKGNALDKLRRIPKQSVHCVTTSTPYWGLRIYKEPFFAHWSDGGHCPYGHEQTPESFIRHTTEVLALLYDVLADTGSIWWNIMDSFNTRTQIRGNAVEALQAMQGKDNRSWRDHECRRYSSGHSYLKDGEQCLIPTLVAQRASRLGFYVKSVITWAKTSTLPEPQNSRVSRNLEYILHLTKVRTPHFDKEVYRSLSPKLGGRNLESETDKLSDVWKLPTSSGRDGHGAQFPISLPGRCIALSTSKGDVVLDPFVGSGNSGIAARALERRFIGIDVCKEYLSIAEERISNTACSTVSPVVKPQNAELSCQGTLLSLKG